MIFLLSHVHVVAVFWETGSGEDQHAEECSVDPSQPSLPAVCHQRRGKLSCAHQVRPKYGTCLTRSISLTQLYEEVRKSLEQCNIQEDIEHFINLRRTGDKPPGTLSNSFFFFFLRQAHCGHNCCCSFLVNSIGIHGKIFFAWGPKISPHRFRIAFKRICRIDPQESCLVWKWLSCELHFICYNTIEKTVDLYCAKLSWHFTNVTALLLCILICKLLALINSVHLLILIMTKMHHTKTIKLVYTTLSIKVFTH